MEKKNKAKIIRTRGLLFAFLFLFLPLVPSVAEAVVISDNFDTYTGNLTSNGWFRACGSGQIASVAGLSYSSPNSMEADTNSANNNCTHLLFPQASRVAISGYVYWNGDDSGGGVGQLGLSISTATGFVGAGTVQRVNALRNGEVSVSSGTPPDDFEDGGVVLNEGWNYMAVSVEQIEGDNYYRVVVNNYDSGWLFLNSTAYVIRSAGFFIQDEEPHRASHADNILILTDTDYIDPEAPPPCTDGGSCLLTITPERGATIATTTATSTTFTIGVTGHVSEEDFEEGMYVEQSYYRQSTLWGGSVITSQVGSAPNSFLIEWPITSAGDFSFSTTTTVQDISGLVDSQTGEYYHKATLAYPEGFFKKVIGFFGFQTSGEELLEINTRFIIGAKNFIDTVYDDPTNFVTGGNGNPSPILDCDIDLDFNLVACVYSLIIPQSGVMGEVWQSFVDNALSTVPLGYITRFVAIVANPSSQVPPPLEYTFGSSSPEVLQGKGVSFQIFDNFGFLNSIEADDGSGKNIWDIVMPYFNTVIALGVLGVILHDLIAIAVPDRSRGGGSNRKDEEMSTKDIDNMKINDYSDATEEEWSNLKRNRLI